MRRSGQLLICFTLLALLANGVMAGVHPVANRVENRFIVVLTDTESSHVPAHAQALQHAFGGRVLFTYESIPGYAVEMPLQAAEALSRHPLVDYVEEVATVQLPESELQLSTGYQPVTGQGLWHLDRLDERQFSDGLDGLYAFCTTMNVRAYVVDTGVRAGHSEFQPGQVEAGFDATLGAPGTVGTPSDPCNTNRVLNGYHGTAVASVLAGYTTGVSRFTIIVPVRVFGCNYETSTDIAVRGLDWIRVNGVKPAVVNISWFTSNSPTFRTALTSLRDAGYAIFASANNFPLDDACTKYPAGYSQSTGGPVVTMGGTMIGAKGNGLTTVPQNLVDYRWQDFKTDGTPKTTQDGGSSWGPCVDLWAPAHATKVADYRTTGGVPLPFGNILLCANGRRCRSELPGKEPVRNSRGDMELHPGQRDTARHFKQHSRSRHQYVTERVPPVLSRFVQEPARKSVAEGAS